MHPPADVEKLLLQVLHHLSCELVGLRDGIESFYYARHTVIDINCHLKTTTSENSSELQFAQHCFGRSHPAV